MTTLVWRDDVARSVSDLLARADDAVARLRATQPTRQARDAALDAVSEAAKTLVREGCPSLGARLFAQASRLNTPTDTARALRAVESLQRGIAVLPAVRAALAAASTALDTLIAVYQRDAFEPTYELERVREEPELADTVIELDPEYREGNRP
jgi:hypothetical protein